MVEKLYQPCQRASGCQNILVRQLQHGMTQGSPRTSEFGIDSEIHGKGKAKLGDGKRK